MSILCVDGRRRVRLAPVLHHVLALVCLGGGIGCGGGAAVETTGAAAKGASIQSLPADSSGASPYTVSARGGTPATGPGSRFNHCERIWCMDHLENFALDHFLLARHIGWILHDDAMGDAYVPRGRSGGPSYPKAKLTVLRLCGAHVHPHSLGSKGRGSPVRDGMYTVGLGYNRAHFREFGTRLEPCCLNGSGWDFVHSGGRFFRFHDIDEYRGHPERGWQKPFQPDTSPMP